MRQFKEDPSLTDAEISIIASWVDVGAPRGNPEDAPPPIALESLDEWRIGTPEWIVELPEEQTIGDVDADRWLDMWADARTVTLRRLRRNPLRGPILLCIMWRHRCGGKKRMAKKAVDF